LEKVDVPKKRIVKFKVGRMMRKKVSGEDVGPDDFVEEDDDELDAPPPSRARGPQRGEAGAS
jgi:hypothetical protein